MEDTVREVEEIPEKGITVTTVVADGLIETAVRPTNHAGSASGQVGAPELAIVQRPLSAGNPLLQHDLIVRDVYAGSYGDVSEQAVPEVTSVPEDYVAPD